MQPVDVANFKNAIVLDIRTDKERENGKIIEGVIHIPLFKLPKASDQSLREFNNNLDTNKPIFVFCIRGPKAVIACEILEENGFTDTYYTGTVDNWLHAGITKI